MDVFFWLVVVACVVGYLFSGGKKQRKRPGYRFEKSRSQPGGNGYRPDTVAVKEDNTAERQLATVRSSEFRKRTLMNKSEYAVYCQLEALLSMTFPAFRVFVQVSLGEILGSDNKAAYLVINSKRADFVIIDRFGHLL